MYEYVDVKYENTFKKKTTQTHTDLVRRKQQESKKNFKLKKKLRKTKVSHNFYFLKKFKKKNWNRNNKKTWINNL